MPLDTGFINIAFIEYKGEDYYVRHTLRGIDVDFYLMSDRTPSAADRKAVLSAYRTRVKLANMLLETENRKQKYDEKLEKLDENTKEMDEIAKEIDKLAEIYNENIPVITKLSKDIYQKDEEYFFVCDYCGKRSLYDYETQEEARKRLFLHVEEENHPVEALEPVEPAKVRMQRQLTDSIPTPMVKYPLPKRRQRQYMRDYDRNGVGFVYTWEESDWYYFACDNCGQDSYPSHETPSLAREELSRHLLSCPGGNPNLTVQTRVPGNPDE